MREFVNREHHCFPESVYRQTWKLLTLPKRPHDGIQPGAMPQLLSLDLRILLHHPKNLLIEELPWTLHQLLLRLKFIPSKMTLVVSKLSPTERRQPLVPPAVITVYILLECRTLLPYQLFRRRKDSRLFSFPDLALKSLVTMLRSF
jgi:hypothetical protein